MFADTLPRYCSAAICITVLNACGYVDYEYAFQEDESSESDAQDITLNISGDGSAIPETTSTDSLPLAEETDDTATPTPLTDPPAPSAPTNFLLASWQAPATIGDITALPNNACAREPVLSPDGQWLFFLSELTGNGCTWSQPTHATLWNDGNPDYSAAIAMPKFNIPVDTETNPEILDGSLYGEPDEYRYFFSYNINHIISVSLLKADLSAVPGSVEETLASVNNTREPTFFNDGTQFIYMKASNPRGLYQASGTPGDWDSYTSDFLVSSDFVVGSNGGGDWDPTVTPDGRVLIFQRSSQDRHYIATRESTDVPFGVAAPFDTGAAGGDNDLDGLFTPDGDFLFASDRSGRNELYRMAVTLP